MIESGADKSQLLADGGEDEVGLLLGNVAERRLQTVEQPRAVNATRTDGALRVAHLVDEPSQSRVGRVLVQKGREPIDLVLAKRSR